MFKVRNLWLLGVACGAFLGGQAQAAPPLVDCDKAKDDNLELASAVEKADAGEVVTVLGDCTDVALVISRANVGLQGPATLHGTGSAAVITVRDGGNVTLADLSLTGGNDGLAVNSARATATNVNSSMNAAAGFSVVQSASLLCNGCTGNNNGVRGLLVTSSVTLCGANQFNGNTSEGILVFLGGRIFGDTPVCGGPPSVEMSGNATGLSLYENGSVFTNGVSLNISNNTGTGIAAQDSSAITVDNGNVVVNDNGSFGAFVSGGTTVKLNLSGVATTSLQGNLLGVILQQNSQISSNGATITGSVVGLDVQVSDFSIANLNGTIGPTFCEPGQSSGTSCP